MFVLCEDYKLDVHVSIALYGEWESLVREVKGRGLWAWELYSKEAFAKTVLHFSPINVFVDLFREMRQGCFEWRSFSKYNCWFSCNNALNVYLSVSFFSEGGTGQKCRLFTGWGGSVFGWFVSACWKNRNFSLYFFIMIAMILWCLASNKSYECR